MADVEIRISSKDNGGSAGLQRVERDAKSLETSLKRVSDIKIDTKAKVDTSEVRRAEGDIRDLDKIPPPEVKPRVETSQMAGDLTSGIDGALAAVDPTKAGGVMIDKLGDFLGGGAVGAVIGAAASEWGDDIADGFGRGLSGNRGMLQEQIRVALPDRLFEEAGRAAGEAWSGNFGESFDQVQQSAVLLQKELGTLDESLDLTGATEKAQTFAQVFGVEIPEQIRFTQRMFANDLVGSVDEGFDLMVATAREFPTTFGEIMEVLNEFAPVFSKMGISGAEAANIIGTAFREGLLPNIDRGAELFEEFNIQLTDGGGREAVERLGLSFEVMQSKLANGQGKEALQQIAQALLDTEDAALRNEIAIDLFGASIESASDPVRVLELLAQADAMDEVAGSADEMVESAEGLVTSWDRVARWADQLGHALGQNLAGEITKVVDGFQMLIDNPVTLAFGDLIGVTDHASDSMAGFVKGVIASDLELAKITTNLDGAGAGMNFLEDSARPAAEGINDLRAAAAEGADSMADLEDSTDSAIAAIRGWADDSLQSAIIDVFNAADDLTNEFAENAEEAFKVSTGWDLMTAAGQAGAQQTSDLRSQVAELRIAMIEGGEGAIQAEQALYQLEASLRATLSQSNLTEGAIEALIQDILGVHSPDPVVIDLVENVTAGVQRVQAAIGAIDGARAITYVDTIRRTFDSRPKTYGRAVGGVPPGEVPTAASGGVRDNLTWVGEEGPELVDLGVGARVHTAPDSQRMAGVGARSEPAMNLSVYVMGSVLSERDLKTSIRDAMYRGGFDGLGGLEG